MTGPDAYVADNRQRMLEELKALLGIPSVSTDSLHDADCRRAAEWLAEHLRGLGCPRAELLGSRTHPVVYAEGPSVPRRPTVLVYGHYDVQPPDPLESWESPPFEPMERDGNLYARGATDDKGQLFSIIKAFQAVNIDGGPPINLRFLIEGQEESGSQVLSALIAKDPARIRADVVLVSDGQYYAPGWPTVKLGVRGICYVEIAVRTLRSDLHSGLYGGVAPNAHEALVRILAALKTPAGRIRIPGLYDDVRRPSRQERDGWKRLPFDPGAFTREGVGAAALAGEARYPVHERLWARPTLDIHGISGGYTGEGSKTVIPAEASAKLSLRLVPDQRAHDVFRQLEQAVQALAPKAAELDVRLLQAADPILIDTTHPAFARIDRAFHEVEGRGVVFTRSGGSLPILAQLGKGGAAIVLAGIGLPDDRPHAPNEKISIEQFTRGIRVFARFFQSMADTNGG